MTTRPAGSVSIGRGQPRRAMATDGSADPVRFPSARERGQGAWSRDGVRDVTEWRGRTSAAPRLARTKRPSVARRHHEALATAPERARSARECGDGRETERSRAVKITEKHFQ